jgi:hypothetical protein
MASVRSTPIMRAVRADFLLQDGKVDASTAAEFDHGVAGAELEGVDGTAAVGVFPVAEQVVEVGGEVVVLCPLAVEVN